MQTIKKRRKYQIGDEVVNTNTGECGLVAMFNEGKSGFWVDYGQRGIGPYGSGPESIFELVRRRENR